MDLKIQERRAEHREDPCTPNRQFGWAKQPTTVSVSIAGRLAMTGAAPHTIDPPVEHHRRRPYDYPPAEPVHDFPQWIRTRRAGVRLTTVPTRSFRCR